MLLLSSSTRTTTTPKNTVKNNSCTGFSIHTHAIFCCLLPRRASNRRSHELELKTLCRCFSLPFFASCSCSCCSCCCCCGCCCCCCYILTFSGQRLSFPCLEICFGPSSQNQLLFLFLFLLLLLLLHSYILRATFKLSMPRNLFRPVFPKA